MNIAPNVPQHNTSLPTPPPGQPGPTPPPPPSDRAVLRQQQKDAERKLRTKRAASLSSRLSAEQGLQLLQWFDTGAPLSEIQRLVAAPPPEGFGIRTNITTLQRLRAAQHSTLMISNIESMVETVRDIEKHSPLDHLDRVQAIISNMLHHRALELARETPDSPSFTRILASIEKLSALEHKRQKMVLEREKLHSAAHPRRHHVDLNIVRPIDPSPNLAENSASTVNAEPPQVFLNR